MSSRTRKLVSVAAIVAGFAVLFADAAILVARGYEVDAAGGKAGYVIPTDGLLIVIGVVGIGFGTFFLRRRNSG